MILTEDLYIFVEEDFSCAKVWRESDLKKSIMVASLWNFHASYGDKALQKLDFCQKAEVPPEIHFACLVDEWDPVIYMYSQT